MAHSEVLLVKPVEGLGGEGDQVKVRAGYARNYLLPRKIAVTLTGANRKQVDSLKKRRAEREQDELTRAQDFAKKLEKTSLAFAVKTGEGGRMFGAITANDIHDKLVASGVELDKKKIHLEKPIHLLGEHEIELRLHADVKSSLKIILKSTNPLPEIKAEEKRLKAQRHPDAAPLPARTLGKVKAGLPALSRALELQKAAGRVGFDWNDIHAVLDKIKEESAEVADAVAAGRRDHVEEEVGDLLFVMVNLARHAGVDPETALRGANAKFEQRFAYVEDALRARGSTPQEATLADMDALWDEAKAKAKTTGTGHARQACEDL